MSSRTVTSILRPLLVAIAGLLLIPALASAEVTVDGTGEPEFTSSTQNTQFVRWQSPSGADAYRLRAVYYRDSVEVTRLTYDVAASGTSWLNWAGVAQLEDGHTYAICVTGLYSLPNDSLFFPDGPDSCTQGRNAGKRTSTTIDRSKPVVSIQVAGGAATTRSTLLPVTITYQDGYSPPFPANFLCVGPGNDENEACSNRIYGYDAGCSQPAASTRSTTFQCEVETNSINPPDGKLLACVISADSAVPDNPSSPDQTSNAGRANHSEKTCDSVILDRTAPTAAINTASATVTRGTRVTFDAQVSDALSGVAPDSVRWNWDDGTSPSAGNSAIHAFPAADTYTVQLEVADAAGNKTVVSKEITVVDPPAGESPTGGGGSPTGGGGSPTGGGEPDPQPSTGTPPTGENGACEGAMSKLAKAKKKLTALKRQVASKAKIRRAKASVKRAKAATREACAA